MNKPPLESPRIALDTPANVAFDAVTAGGGYARVEGAAHTSYISDFALRMAALREPDLSKIVVNDLVEFERPALWDGSPGTAVVVAGGRGERLSPHTNHRPKPLVDLGGETLIDGILNSISDAHVRRIYVATHYLAELVEEYVGDGSRFGMEISYVREPRPLHTAGCLTILPLDVEGPIVVVNADLILQTDLRRVVEFHLRLGADITIGAFSHSYDLPYATLSLDGATVEAINEKPTFSWPCNAGFYVIEPDVIKDLPRESSLGMDELISNAAADGRTIVAFPVLEPLLDITTPQDLEHARQSRSSWHA